MTFDGRTARGRSATGARSTCRCPERTARCSFLIHQVTDVTDAVLGSKALERAEQRAARILDRMTDAHCLLDKELRVVALNPAAERMTGRSRDDVIGLVHREAFPDSFDPETDAAYRRVVAQGEEQHLQQRFVRDGRDVHLEIDAYATADGGVAIFARDITERVRAVETRRESEAQQFLGRLGDTLHSLSDPAEVQAEAARLLVEQLGATRVVYGETGDGDDESVVVMADCRREGLPPLARIQRFDDYGTCVTKSLRAKQSVVAADVRQRPELPEASVGAA